MTGASRSCSTAARGAVRRLAIVSGGAAHAPRRPVAEGFDAFLTGEPSEHVMADAREAGIHFIAPVTTPRRRRSPSRRTPNVSVA